MLPRDGVATANFEGNQRPCQHNDQEDEDNPDPTMALLQVNVISNDINPIPISAFSPNGPALQHPFKLPALNGVGWGESHGPICTNRIF